MLRSTLHEELLNQLGQGRTVAQATVVHVLGSTPRKPGAAMLVRQDGTLVGTIGGGCGEAGVIQKARLSLLDGRMREETADLTEDIALESEAVCGGVQRVFIEPWQPSGERIALARLLMELARGETPVVVHQVVRANAGGPGLNAGPTLVPGFGLGARIVVNGEGVVLHQDPLPPELKLPELSQDRTSQLFTLGSWQVFSERWNPQPTLVVVGAGHVAEPLERLGRMAGFRTVVVDDRTLFANRERFPDAAEVICGPILEVMRTLPLSSHHYVVLVTRGHTLDMDALKVMLERGEPVAYLGMIGSKRRVGAVFQLLEEQGYPRGGLGRVHSPVGLNIGAETPAEIAVSVLAEMISVRRGAGADTRPLTVLSGRHPSLRRGEAG
ncbi:MAG: XdhC family protein [Deltaproteobacteria bacterium]|nr:XdhC family protein [Deltaproteobacteria bacterium]